MLFVNYLLFILIDVIIYDKLCHYRLNFGISNIIFLKLSWLSKAFSFCAIIVVLKLTSYFPATVVFQEYCRFYVWFLEYCRF